MNRMTDPYQILVVDDEEIFLKQFANLLKMYGFKVAAVSNPYRALKLINQQDFDCIILDVHMPGIDGVSLLKKMSPYQIYTPVIMFTQNPKVQHAVRSLRLGAVDFVEKTEDTDVIIQKILDAIDKKNTFYTDASLKYDKELLFSQFNIVVKSPVMNTVIAMIRKAATTDVNVLLLGETGVGKTYFASAIHYWSKRADYPFISISMANLQETLIESELFGHKKGAFTQAYTDKQGLLKIADKGTVFLDEVGELPVGLQAKLNQFLDTQTFVPLGSSKFERVNVRVIAATNKPVDELIHGRTFRQDLYYRLSGIVIRIPPLRERREDIKPLAEYFLDKFKGDKNIIGFHPLALQIMEHYNWPGNVRELEHFIHKLVILTDSEVITPEFVKEALKSTSLLSLTTPSSRSATLGIKDLKTAKEEFEKEYIRYVLEMTNNNRSRTAELLKIDRAHLHRKLKKFNLE